MKMPPILAKNIKQKEYLDQVGLEFNEIYLSEQTEDSSKKSANLILSAINASQPDLLVTGASIGKFNFFTNPQFIAF